MSKKQKFSSSTYPCSPLNPSVPHHPNYSSELVEEFFLTRVPWEDEGDEKERDEVNGEVEDIRDTTHRAHETWRWLWDERRLKLEPQCACIKQGRQLKDNDTHWQQKKREYENEGSSMHDGSCNWHQLRSQVPQVFHVTSHIVGIFALYFVSSIQFVAVLIYSFFDLYVNALKRFTLRKRAVSRCCLCTPLVGCSRPPSTVNDPIATK